MAGILEDTASMLDTVKADRSVWLMKCPQVISQAWKEINDSGQPLAKITVSVDPCKTDDQHIEAKVEDPTAPSAMRSKVERQEMSSTMSQTQSTRSIKSEFMMEVGANGSVTAPKSYTLNMSNDIIPMYIFSETSEGKVSIDGKVEHKFDMKPHSQNIDDYRRLCRERTNKSNFRARQVQVIDNDRGGYNPMQGMMDFSSILSKDRRGSAAPIKTQEMKRTRMDRGELENILFKLFERQSNWTLKQLVMETDQPQNLIGKARNKNLIYLSMHSTQHPFVRNISVDNIWFSRQSARFSRWGSASRHRLLHFIVQEPMRLMNVEFDSTIIEALAMFLYKLQNFTDGLDSKVCLCEFEENGKAWIPAQTTMFGIH